MGFEEKRLYPRIEANVQGNLLGESVILFHAVENVSLGGISLKAPSVERTGTIVELLLHFDGDTDSFACLGEVVWSREGEEGQMGVKFLGLNEEQKAWLRRRLAQLDPIYAI